MQSTSSLTVDEVPRPRFSVHGVSCKARHVSSGKQGELVAQAFGEAPQSPECSDHQIGIAWLDVKEPYQSHSDVTVCRPSCARPDCGLP